MKTAKRILTYLICAFLVLVSLCVFVPSSPWYPNLDSDASWMFAVNQAVAQKLVFGRDIIFTYGPYASIHTGLYHKSTYPLMLWGSLLIAVCYSVLMILLARGRGLYWVLVYGLFLKAFAGNTDDRDSLFFSYPLLIALVIYLVTLPEGHPRRLQLSPPLKFALAVVMAPLGLLPLIKGTLIMTVAIFAVLFFVVFWRQGQRLLACCTLILPPVSAVLFWLIAHQPVTALPAFLMNMGEIISGYTDAMSVNHENGLQIATWVVVAVFILHNATATKSDPMISRMVLFLSFGLFLFVSFKEAFVRHDGVVAGVSALMAAVLLNVLFSDRMAIAALLLSVVWCGGTGARVFLVSPEKIYHNIMSAYSAVTYDSPFEGMRLHWSGADKKKFADSIETIRKKVPIPKLAGTTDIYSTHQTELLASGNSWSPRPVIQSYSVYTPRLAALNEAHLQSDRTPDNILFRIDPIDGRLPALEDGLSWPTIIHNYSVVEMRDEFAYLRKRENPHKGNPITILGTGVHRLGEEVHLPAATEPLFAEIEVSPTLLGRLVSLLFKTDQLHISIQYKDGASNYRLIPKMAESRFVLSPLIEDTSDFILLSGLGKGDVPVDVPVKAVKSIRIFASGGTSLFWQTAYSIKLSSEDLGGDTDLDKFSLFDRIRTERPEAHSEGPGIQCDFGLDSINGMAPDGTPRFPPSPISSQLSVKGWTAISAKDGIVADEVFLTLSNAKQRLYVKARIGPRPDVNSHFGHPEMPDSGITAKIDVSKLNGAYTLGLASIYKGKFESCQKFNLPPLHFSR